MWEHHGFHPFGFIILALIITLLVFKIIAYRRHGGWHYGGYNGGYTGHHHRFDGKAEAEAILMRRFASGEIDETEFTRLKEFLNK